MSKAIVKTTFEATKTLRPIYTGGSTALDSSGRILLSCVSEDANIVDLETGDQLASLEGDGEIITSLAITPSASHAVVCSRSMTMRIYELSPFDFDDKSTQVIEAKPIRTLKPHTSPVVTTAIDHTGTLLATGAADGSIKVHDIRGGFVTHTFNDRGVISALCFFEVSAADNDKSSTKKSKKKAPRDDDEDMEDADPTVGFRLASGSEEGRVRVFDLHKKKAVASLDSHVSLVRSLSFSATENALLSASRDKTVIIYDARTYKQRRIIPVLESVEAASFVADSGICVIGGEHGKLRAFDINRGSEITQEQEGGEDFETIIAIQYSPGLPFAMTVHADQTIRIHSLETLMDYKPGFTLKPLTITRRISGNDDEIIDCAFVGPDRSMLALATNTESIRIVSVAPSEDRPSAHGDDFFGADVAYLDGHEDIIIAMDVDWSGHWLVTAGKDNTARLFRLDPKNSSYSCFATLTGHAESLGAIAFPRSPPPVGSSAYNDPANHPPAFLVTGSQDKTIKRWDLGKLGPLNDDKPHTPKAVYTRKAHEKDINSIDIDSTSTLFASASQDRTVKIFDAEEGSAIGILRGHKRGVWGVRFCPKNTPVINTEAGTSTNKGVIATGSGDKTVKIWNLVDYSCLLTLESHSNSVLKVIWLPPPQVSKQNSEDDEDEEAAASKQNVQTRPLVASAGADGLVKLWNVWTGEVECTIDNHTDRVWALASPYPSGFRSDAKPTSSKLNTTPYALVSGSADATVTCWTDTTSATYTAAVNANSERVEQDQQLQNYIRAGAYREAITLALQLNHPGRLLSLFTTAIDAADDPARPEEERQCAADSLTGNPSIDEVLQSLDATNLRTLLLRLRDWNTNARTSLVSQRILYALFRSYPASTFVELATQSVRGKNGRAAAGLKDILQALATYTERHYKRVEELTDDSYLVEWVLGEMDGGVGLGGLMSLDQNGADGEGEKDVIMMEA
ncbi:hypothetical protein N7532_000363 [Penicillium argentinense]|uniref:U3 small nucleolar RNA-associated protein 13 C-terminal domain-containing protein n=1 Tax=Penicillium argentinense TaxID=1131581 RepID=A0A9W9KNT0_9EURO|nr:uncharacterized protein N7532_000363 [Penicillium argentinense]KAJ5112318.1 hypothetical protein N7532_000363 [Penicillium argentinense]